MQSQKWQNDLSSFPRQTIQHHSNPSLWPYRWFCRSWSWPVLWRLTTTSRTNTKKDVLFIIGDLNAKVGSQEKLKITDKFGLRVQNEAGQRLKKFYQEHIQVIANTLFQQPKRRLYIWTSPDGQYHTVKAIIFPVTMSNSQMWELDHKEGWEPKNWFFWIVVPEKTLENPLYCKEIKPVNPKGNQPWMVIGRTVAKAEALAT